MRVRQEKRRVCRPCCTARVGWPVSLRSQLGPAPGTKCMGVSQAEGSILEWAQAGHWVMVHVLSQKPLKLIRAGQWE